jgi:hypothetical protein
VPLSPQPQATGCHTCASNAATSSRPNALCGAAASATSPPLNCANIPSSSSAAAAAAVEGAAAAPAACRPTAWLKIESKVC